ncbi:MAG: hypothetical protein Q9191_002889 [Dirinaria sp. TL-2023a]
MMWHTVEVCSRIDHTSNEDVFKSSNLLLSLSLDGTTFEEEIRLPQPFRDDYVEEVRWYLESFIPKDSFDLQKANFMASYLKDIGTQLYLHVGLPLLVRLLRNTKDVESTFNIEINIRQTGEPQGQQIQNIYWELLEDPEFWLLANVNALVRRYLTGPVDGSIKVSLNQPPQSIGHAAQSDVNVLLVLARDCSGDAEDAQTDLAYQHLLNAKSQMEKTSNARHLNLHIVRPGSFPALKEHLMNASIQHGRGFYNIVHFDLHGRVAKRKGVKESFLYFASATTDSKKLTPVSSKAVAEVLASYGCPIAVLNACDSARSGLETDANLASVFVSAGINNVLAMSHRLLESAANSFIKAFYHTFLIEAKPFSVAAASARATLRADPMRMTRFRSSEPLMDWIIPVVYTSGQDVIFPGDVKPRLGANSSMPALDNFEKQAEEVLGRGGDILQIDRFVVEHSPVMILGSPGVGKSALVDELCSLWKQTASFNFVIYINVREHNIRSRADLVERIASSILALQPTQDVASTIQLALRGGVPKEKDAAILSEIRSKSTVLILDGIRDGHHNLPLQGWPPYLPPTAVSELCGFVNEAVSPAASGHRQTRVILVTRHDLDSLWRNRLENADQVATFSVPNLSLADAFDLATKVFVQCDVAVPTWYQKDADALEQILLLCDLNPLAIRHVVTALAGDLKIGFNNLLMNSISLPFLVYMASDSKGYSTHYLTFEDLESAPFGNGHFWQSKGNSFLFEMYKVWQSMHPPLQLALCFLGLYWHSGPIAGEWLQMMVEWGVCEQIEGFHKVIQIVGNRLWLESEDQNRITYIHPLLTMFLRDRLCDQEPVWNKEDIGQRAFAVLQTFRCMLMDQEPDEYFQWAVLHEFLTNMGTRLISAHLKHASHYVTSTDSVSPWLHTELYNFLFVCGLCTSDKLRIAPSKWPRDGFAIFFQYVLKAEESVHYRKKSIEAVERLLCSLEDQYDEIMDDPEVVFFWVMCMSHFLDMYTSKIRTFPEKVITRLVTVSTFIGGLDQTIFDHFLQARLLALGDLCHKAALYLVDNNADDSEIVKEQATDFYLRALQRAIEASHKGRASSVSSGKERSTDSLGLENEDGDSATIHANDTRQLQLDTAEISLLLEVRELEWQIVQQKTSGETDVNEKLQELGQQFSTLLADLPKRSKPTATSTNDPSKSSKTSASAVKPKSTSAQLDQTADLALAYDETDIVSAAANHYKLSARLLNNGEIQDAARHLARLNELIRGDKDLEAKFSSLEQQTQLVGVATRVQELADSIESTAKSSDFQSMEENWREAYTLLGVTPSSSIAELQEAFREMMKMQRNCQSATMILARLDPPQPRWEMRDRRSQRYESSGARDISTDDQVSIDTAWLRSCTDTVEAIEKGEYQKALGHVEIMEELQSGDMVTWHNASPMTATKRWLKEEDEFLNLSRLAKDAVSKGDFNTASSVIRECTELDKKLGNRHGEFLEERKRALQRLQWDGYLSQAKQLGESDHFAEALSTIADIEKEKAQGARDERNHLLASRFENDLLLAKHQIMMRFAVKEKRHLDAAHSAQQCVALLEQTSEEEMPSLSKPRVKLIQACAALGERAMIWYHQAGLADALQRNEAFDDAIRHLDALVVIGRKIDAYHPPEWVQVHEELDLLLAQKESLESRRN